MLGPVIVAERADNEVPAPNRKLIIAAAAHGPEITTPAPLLLWR